MTPGRGRGSERGATTIRRGSDPGPPVQRDLRTLRVPDRCKGKCNQPKPREAYPLLGDPRAKAERWKTRLWCVECLVDGGHLPKAAAQAYYRLLDNRRRRAAAEDHHVRRLTDLAKGDPVFAAALRRAAKSLDG